MSRKGRIVLTLVAGAVLAVAASLSIHAVMLQGLHVPYPADRPVWTRLPDFVLKVAGVIALERLLRTDLRKSATVAALTVLITLLLVNEQAIRAPLMEIVNLSNLTLYPFVDMIPQYLAAALVVVAVVACRRFTASWAGAALVAVVLGVAVYGVAAPFLTTAFAPIRAWTQAREGHELYAPPYDWHILVPAYLTFIEPVVGAFVVAGLVSPNLPKRSAAATAALAGLVFALRGQGFGWLTFVFVSGMDPVTSMLSVGQFSLESLALATITAVSWVGATRGFGTKGVAARPSRANPAHGQSSTLT